VTAHRAELAALAILGACALDNQTPDGGGSLTVIIGSIVFHVGSGGVAMPSGQTLAFYLADQPDACLAVTQVPVGTATVFTATVGAGGPSAVVALGPGAGALIAETGGTPTARYNIADGSVAWKLNADGSYQLEMLDVGFSGTSDRMRLADLTLPLCP
jgi:hypothetical protein